MHVELDNHGERKTVTVNKAGAVYLGKALADTEIELAYEVTDNE